MKSRPSNIYLSIYKIYAFHYETMFLGGLYSGAYIWKEIFVSDYWLPLSVSVFGSQMTQADWHWLG